MERRKPKRIKLRNSPDHPLSEREIVDATIAFANGATLELIESADPSGHSLERPEPAATTDQAPPPSFRFGPRKWLTGYDLDKLSTACPPGLSAEGKQEFEATKRELEQLIDEMRRVIRGLLEMIVSAPISGGIADAYSKWGLMPGVDAKVNFRRVGNGIALDFYYSFENVGGLAALGVLFLQDTERGFFKKLCQCKLESCGVFFFEVKQPTGCPQRKYCLREHMLEAHDLNAAKRMKEYRSKPKPGRKK
jgi:hypothetical protein